MRHSSPQQFPDLREIRGRNFKKRDRGITLLVRSTTYKRACNNPDAGTELSPSPSVGLSPRSVYCDKTADWIWMSFGVVSGVGRGMDVLDGGEDLRRGMGSFEGEWGLCGVVILCREGWRRGSSKFTLAFLVLNLHKNVWRHRRELKTFLFRQSCPCILI